MADNDFAATAKALKEIPKELRKEIRPALRDAGRDVLKQVRLNASWSSRIPGATRISTSFTGSTPGVSIVTNAKRAPHAKTFEFGLSHPVFGNRAVWVKQRQRPFQYPAVVQKGPAAEKQIAGAVDRVTRRAGFR